jgi:hypothetical protein
MKGETSLCRLNICRRILEGTKPVNETEPRVPSFFIQRRKVKMVKTVEVFEGKLTKDLRIDPVVDMIGEEKFIKHHKGYKKGETVTIQKLVDRNGKVEYVIPTGTFRCEGLHGVDPYQWQTSSRGAVTVTPDCFVETPKKRALSALLMAWAQGNSK